MVVTKIRNLFSDPDFIYFEGFQYFLKSEDCTKGIFYLKRSTMCLLNLVLFIKYLNFVLY